MKKKIIAGIITAVLVIICVIIYNFYFYTLHIDNPDEIVKIRYIDYHADVYEITDEDIVDEIIEDIDGMSFTRGQSLANQFFSTQRIEFIDEEGYIKKRIRLFSDNSIISDDSHEYVSDENIDTDYLFEVGTYAYNERD